MKSLLLATLLAAGVVGLVAGHRSGRIIEILEDRTPRRRRDPHR